MPSPEFWTASVAGGSYCVALVTTSCRPLKGCPQGSKCRRVEPIVRRRIMYSAFRQSRIICRAFTRDPDDQGYEQGHPTKIQRKRDRQRRQQLYKQRFLKSALRYLLWVWEAFSVCDAEKIAPLSYPNLVLFLENPNSGCPVVTVQKAAFQRVVQSRSLCLQVNLAKNRCRNLVSVL